MRCQVVFSVSQSRSGSVRRRCTPITTLAHVYAVILKTHLNALARCLFDLETLKITTACPLSLAQHPLSSQVYLLHYNLILALIVSMIFQTFYASS